jgi:hypothetical protein
VLRRHPATSVLVVWTLLVWTTRIGNIWDDDALNSGEKWARTALALSFTVLAVGVALALVRRARWLDVAVKVLAGWTLGVWVVRSIEIATGDEGAAFVVVHLVLAVISVVLAALAVGELSRRPARPAWWRRR